MQKLVSLSIVLSRHTDILIIDEALSVGDAIFQAKCMLKLRSMIAAKNLTILFVSHSTFAVRNLCQSAILLDSGSLVKFGTASEVSELYFSLNVKASQITKSNQAQSINSSGHLSNFSRVRNGQGQFESVILSNSEGITINSVSYGQDVNLKFEVTFNEDIECVGYGFHNGVAEYIDFIPLAYNFEMQKRQPVQIYGLVGLENKTSIENF